MIEPITDRHEKLKTIKAQDAAVIIALKLRDEWAEYYLDSSRPVMPKSIVNVRIDAGYYLTKSHPMAEWARDTPVITENRAEVRDWILRGLGRLSDILEPWRTDRAAETILADHVKAGAE